MAKYWIEFAASIRGEALIEADTAEEAQAQFQDDVDNWGDEYLEQYVTRRVFEIGDPQEAVG